MKISNEFDRLGLILKKLTREQLIRLEQKLANERELIKIANTTR